MLGSRCIVVRSAPHPAPARTRAIPAIRSLRLASRHFGCASTHVVDPPHDTRGNPKRDRRPQVIRTTTAGHRLHAIKYLRNATRPCSRRRGHPPGSCRMPRPCTAHLCDSRAPQCQRDHDLLTLSRNEPSRATPRGELWKALAKARRDGGATCSTVGRENTCGCPSSTRRW